MPNGSLAESVSAGSASNPFGVWWTRGGLGLRRSELLGEFVVVGHYVFDGKAHAASAMVVGWDGKTPVAGTFTIRYNGSTTVPKTPGTYTVVIGFTSSDPNYSNATGVGKLVILPRGKKRHR